MAVILLFLVQSHMIKLLLTSIYSYSRTKYFGNLWYDMYVHTFYTTYNSFSGKEAIPSVSKVALLSQGKGPGHWRSALPRDTGWRTDLCVSDRCQGWSNSCLPGFAAEAQEQISEFADIFYSSLHSFHDPLHSQSFTLGNATGVESWNPL